MEVEVDITHVSTCSHIHVEVEWIWAFTEIRRASQVSLEILGCTWVSTSSLCLSTVWSAHPGQKGWTLWVQHSWTWYGRSKVPWVTVLMIQISRFLSPWFCWPDQEGNMTHYWIPDLSHSFPRAFWNIRTSYPKMSVKVFIHLGGQCRLGVSSEGNFL